MRIALLALLAGTMFAAGCSSDSGTNPPPPPPPPPPTITVAVAGPVSVVQGQSGTTNITVTRGGGFTGAVSLAASGLPAGVTAAFDPASIPGSSGSSVLTLSASATSALGAGQYTVTATGNGVANATANGTVTVTEAPDFALAAAPNPLSVEQGAAGASDITITRRGGFSGAVNLSVAGLPTGVTAAFDNAAPTTNAAQLTLTVGAGAAPGNSMITVTGAGAPGQRTATFTLTVTVPPGSFTLSVDPATATIQAGTSGQTTVSIAKTGSFTGNVALSVTGLPAGVTASFNPAAASPPAGTRDVTTQSVLTLTVGAGVEDENFALVVHGNAEGQAEKTANLTLAVTPPPVGGNVSFKFCDLDDLPLFFAFFDGSGDWTSVAGTDAADGRTYAFTINSSAGGVAWVLGSNGAEGYTTTVFYARQEELTGFGNAQCAATPNTSRTLNGTIAGLAAGETSAIGYGTSGTAVAGPATAFQLKDAPTFSADLFATRSTAQNGPPTPGFYPAKIIIRRNVEYQNGASIPLLDFTNDGFVPASAQLTVGNLNGSSVFTTMNYRTATTVASLNMNINAAVSTMSIRGVPSANQEGSDLHQLTMLASSFGQSRGRTVWFKTMGDRTENLGPVLNDPTIVASGSPPYPRFQASGVKQAEYDDVMTFTVTQQIAVPRSFIVMASMTSQAGPNYTLPIPDLSAAGYQALWAFQTGAGPAVWSLFGFGYSAGGYQQPVVEGGVSQFASKAGQVTP